MKDEARAIEIAKGMTEEAIRAIKMAKTTMPTLTSRGIGIDEPAGYGFSVENVATAIAFLARCQKTKTPKLNSYGLKHAAERWGERNSMQGYVANGELIAAAIYLGFKIKPYGGKNPNVAVAVAVKEVKMLDPAWPLR